MRRIGFFIAPVTDPDDQYAAGYDANVFLSASEAEEAIPGLAATLGTSPEYWTVSTSYVDARTFARWAKPGDYLARYSDVEGPDPGSRCGFGDDDLDEVKRRLAARGLRLDADDVGLIVVTA